MSARFFLDTNIFVYSCDVRYPAKKEKARKLIAEALEKDSGIISFQVVQEFLSVATKKFQNLMSTDEARLYLNEVLEPLCEVFPSMELYRQALEIADDHKTSLYDSLILASAGQAGCKLVYSEDFQNGQKIRGLTIQNPFH